MPGPCPGEMLSCEAERAGGAGEPLLWKSTCFEVRRTDVQIPRAHIKARQARLARIGELRFSERSWLNKVARH